MQNGSEDVSCRAAHIQAAALLDRQLNACVVAVLFSEELSYSLSNTFILLTPVDSSFL